MKKSRLIGLGAATLAAAGIATFSLSTANASTTYAAPTKHNSTAPVDIHVFAPGQLDHAGINGAGWFVDMEVDFINKNLAQTGFNGFQLTGPAAHNNIAPFPGTFSPGQDDKMPGLVVLTSTTNGDRPGFSGPGTNLANLFNVTGLTNQGLDLGRGDQETELWDTWIVGADIAGQDVDTTLTVAEVADLNHDGIFNDAPNVVDDLNHDGKVDGKDLKKLGIASNLVQVPFHINKDVR